MRVHYLGTVAMAALLTLGAVACGANTASLDAGGQQEVVDPCAANPCAANPCAANPCAANPCAANPCAANPCAANPCAANPAAAAADLQPPVYAYEGLAIRGADPVAYFTEGAAVKGSAAYEYQWNGATWRFSSAENRDRFAAEPTAYVPQYGGYCAQAVSEGYLASIDPEAWKIEDGKLYLNYSPGVQRQWLQDVPGHIAQADQNWDGVLANAEVHESGKSW